MLMLVVAVVACSGQSQQAPPINAIDLVGEWRSVLDSPGGELPFALRITEQDGTVVASIVNDTEELPFKALRTEGNGVTLEMPWYDSVLEGQISADGSSIAGRWRKTIPGGISELPWRAERGSSARFRPIEDVIVEEVAPQAPPEITGAWRVTFSDENGDEAARGEFHQRGTHVAGTFLTPTGDYRYLEGSYESGLLRLSTFDGAHAFLFHARAQADGTLAGDFWSRDSYHATWVAEPITADTAVLPDPWQQVSPTRVDRGFSFRFADLEGQVVSSDDARFAGKVLVVNLFGSWCPNCNDEAPLLARWHQRWSADGLEIVGLAFEFSGDSERDRRVLRRYAERHGIEYPLLLAGVSDKAEAALAVPDLSAVLSYPTTVLIGRDGKIRWIHSGFAGPGTGRHHTVLVTEIEDRITALLAETNLK